MSNIRRAIDKTLIKLHNYLMKILDRIKRSLLKFESHIFVTHSCISCRTEILDGSTYQMCKNCLNALEKLEGTLCKRCGEPTNMISGYCGECLSSLKFDNNFSFCYYNKVSAKIVKKLKYGHKKYIAKYIVKLICDSGYDFSNIDAITFVPVDSDRIIARGYNQAEEIARELSKFTNIPLVDVLVKNKTEKHQTELSKAERLKSLSKSFSINSDCNYDIKGKNILIVDDVYTTGTTLSSCAAAIKTKKPKRVFTITFAKTKLNSAK